MSALRERKRKVIEALLCASDDVTDISLAIAAHMVDADYRAICIAVNDTYDSIRVMRFNDRIGEAAYRMIESSPELRREWFGC